MKASDLQVGDILRYCNTFYRVQSFDSERATFFAFNVFSNGNGNTVAFQISLLQEPDEILRAVDRSAGDSGPDALSDAMFVEWATNRLVHVHGDKENNGFIGCLRRIVAKMKETESLGVNLCHTRNDARAANEAAKGASPAFKVGDVVRCGNGPNMVVEETWTQTALFQPGNVRCAYWWEGKFIRGLNFAKETLKAVLPG